MIIWRIIRSITLGMVHLVVPPIRYWTVYHNGHRRVLTVRQRCNPGVEKNYQTCGVVTLDGPHETQDEAVRRLAFWQAQYRTHAKPLYRNQ